MAEKKDKSDICWNSDRHTHIHTRKRPHRCAVCEKTYVQLSELTVHMRTHTGEKPYVCKLCDKGYASNKQLKIHSRTHTGERPFACESCGKTFLYNHVLKLHQMVHLRELLYKCNVCAETFGSKKLLNKHIKLHRVLPQSTLSQQHTDASAEVSSCPPIPPSFTNGMEERPNLSHPQRSQGLPRSLPDVGQLRSRFSLLTDPRNNSRDGTIEGTHHRQQLLTSMLFGSPVNQDSTDRANDLLSCCDWKESQEQRQLRNEIITNGNCNVHHHQHDPNSTYFRNIPPLIPITASCPSPHMMSTLIESEHPEEQQLMVSSSWEEFNKKRQDFEVSYGQIWRPPKKGSRSFEVSQEEDDNSNTSSNTKSNNNCLPSSSFVSSSAEISLQHALSSNSVIRFAHRTDTVGAVRSLSQS